jgi:flagellar protein FliO/FliZ
MNNSISLSRAPAQAAALLGASLLALGCPAAASAAGSAPTTGENTPWTVTTASGGGAHVPSGGPSLVRTVVGLAIVIAVIWGLYWVMRQVKSGRHTRGAPPDGLSTVAALTIASGRSVHLVRAGSDYLLLGSGEHGLVPLHRYSEEEAIEAGLIGPGQSEGRGPVRPTVGMGSLRDPMGGVDPAAGLVERLRQWTVRR